MPAPIIAGVGQFVAEQLEVTVWDGEIPRYSTEGDPISPSAAANTPSTWPVVRVLMGSGGFGRTWTTEDPYDDVGMLTLQVWSTTRASVDTLLNSIEALLVNAGNWQLIELGGDPQNPYYVVYMLLSSWYSGQEEGVRTSQSQLLYRGELVFKTMIHGAIQTR